MVVVDAPATAEPGPVLSGTGPDPDRMPLGRAHRAPEITWPTDGKMVCPAYTLHPDGDRDQAGTLVRDVLDDAAPDGLARNIGGHLLSGVGTGRPAAQFIRVVGG